MSGGRESRRRYFAHLGGAVKSSSRHGRFTDTTIEGNLSWRLAAAVWDLLTLSTLVAATALGLAYALFTILPLVLVFVWIAYLILLFVTVDKPPNEAFPWYLAWKAGKGTGSARYWYGKHRFWLRRYVLRSFRSSAGNLLVQLHTLRTGPPETAQLTADQVPGTRLLLRAFRLKNNELFLKRDSAKAPAIKGAVKGLKTKLKESDTYRDGYLRYLIDIYFGYSEPERKLILAHQEPTMLERLDESPTLQKLFILLVTVVVSLFIYGVLRISGIPLPGP